MSLGVAVAASVLAGFTGYFEAAGAEQTLTAFHATFGVMGLVTRNRFSGFSGGITVELADLDRVQFSANIIAPDGHTALRLRNAHNCSISGNSITTWYTGAVEIDGNMVAEPLRDANGALVVSREALALLD